MLIASTAEPLCPALDDAAEIVQAEWLRMVRPVADVGAVAAELPAPRRPGSTVRTLVVRLPQLQRGTVSRGRPQRAGRPIGTVWPRQRSPP
jgi:hypothetical protein